MNIRSALLLARRNFRTPGKSRRHLSRLSNAVLGISLSLIPLVMVIVVSGGMIEGITSRYLEVASYHMRLSSYSEISVEELESIVRDLHSLPEITAAVPVQQGIALLHTPDDHLGVSVRGIGPDAYESDSGFRKHMEITSGTFNLSLDNAAVVSESVADSLNIQIGDTVKLVTPRRFPGRPVILGSRNFVVQGIFSTGYQELDATLVYIPFDQAYRLFSSEASLYIGVKVLHPFQDMSDLMASVRNFLERGWFINPWYEVERSMFTSLSNTRSLLIFIMALIVCVAAVNISSSLLTLVLEKHEEIAILKSFGTSPDTIAISFLMTGLFTGLAGSVLGMIFGLAAAVNINEIFAMIEWVTVRVIRPLAGLLTGTDLSVGDFKVLNPAYYLESIPVYVDFLDILLVIIMVLALSLGASYFPARKASRLRPLEVLRKHA